MIRFYHTTQETIVKHTDNGRPTKTKKYALAKSKYSTLHTRGHTYSRAMICRCPRTYSHSHPRPLSVGRLLLPPRHRRGAQRIWRASGQVRPRRFHSMHPRRRLLPPPREAARGTLRHAGLDIPLSTFPRVQREK